MKDLTVSNKYLTGSTARTDYRRNALQFVVKAVRLAAFGLLLLTATQIHSRAQAIDAAFAPNIEDGSIADVVGQPDGKVLIGGSFTIVGGQARNGVARLNADGTLDTTFVPPANTTGVVRTIALQSDGSVLVGRFADNRRIGGLVRLNANGSLDTSFIIDVRIRDLRGVRDMISQSDGKILISFSRPSPSHRTDFQSIVRLNTDGTLDTTFVGQLSSTRPFDVLAQQADGKIVVGSEPFNNIFFFIGGNIARLNADGTPDASFPQLNVDTDEDLYFFGGVSAIAVQTDGKILVGGSFATIGGERYFSDVIDEEEADRVFVRGQPRKGIARLNPDGTLDAGFNPSANGAVRSIAVQADGRILVGGDFTIIGGEFRNRLARFNADGTLDATFDQGADATIRAIALQTDNKILAAGDFTNVGGQTRNRLARFQNDAPPIPTPPSPPNCTYSLNPTAADFSYLGATGTVAVTAPDGCRWTAVSENGWMTVLPSASGTGNGSFNYSITARLGRNQPGSSPYRLRPRAGAIRVADQTFTVNQSSGTMSFGFFNYFVTEEQSSLIITVERDGIASGVSSVDYFTRSFDSDFYATPGRDYTAVSGTLTFAEGETQKTIEIPIINDGEDEQEERFDVVLANPANGFAGEFASVIIAKSFELDFDEDVLATARQADGKVLIGGNFTEVFGVRRNRIARTTVDGLLDVTFNPSVNDNDQTTNEQVAALTVQPDGKILVGGSFTRISGVERNGIARLNSDGAVDTGFNAAGLSGAVAGFAQQPDGKIVVVGNLTVTDSTDPDAIYSYNSEIVRLNPDGAIDASFDSPSIDQFIRAIALQPDGKMVVGGSFTEINSSVRQRLARLNADGTLDTAFAASADDTVRTVVRQPDGKLLIGGDFAVVNGRPRERVARSNADGTLDESFDSSSSLRLAATKNTSGTTLNQGTNGIVLAMALQLNGRLIIAGSFTTAGGEPRSNIARLNPNGTLDPTFIQNTNGTINSLTLQPGKVAVGGEFTMVNELTRNRFALLDTGDTPRTRFDYTGDGSADLTVFRPGNGVWYTLDSRNNSFNAVGFGLSTDVPTPADFDGDGRTDIAVYRPSNGVWYRLNSSDGAFSGQQFGIAEDKPVPADFDGDLKADIAVYRPSNGVWYRLNSGNGEFVAQQFGAAEDKPQVGDFDGDRRADLAVFRPSNGTWYRLNSGNGAFSGQQFGLAEDVPTPADYDNDGRADIAVFRPSNGVWYRLNSGNRAFVAQPFGIAEDKPVAADYDGDGRADIAVYRPSVGVWYILGTTTGFTARQWGSSSDIPTPSVYGR